MKVAFYNSVLVIALAVVAVMQTEINAMSITTSTQQ